MLCELCNKNEASITIKQIAENGSSTVHDICEKCAKRFKLDLSGKSNEGIAKIFTLIEERNKSLFAKISCPSCGTRLSNIVKYSRIGCSDCVFYFKGIITNILRKSPKYERYEGKKPKIFKIINSPTADETVNNLRLQLKQAVNIENYELAAYFRDKIKEIENESK